MSDRRSSGNAAWIFLFLWAVIASAAPAAAGRELSCSAPAVGTQSGEVCGLAIATGGQTVYHYLGIPYAAPPVVAPGADCLQGDPGCLRWRAPQPPPAWSGRKPAVEFGAMCMQEDANGNPTGNEDCLFLNVFQPAGASGRPVMVYIHGGAFMEGSASTELFDGAALAASGKIVVVDFNYRLGALGFGVYGSGPYALTGNYGFLDQQFALKWVQNNIRSFGGDPTQVTIAGQSAGAMSVGLHMVSAPSSKGLFRAGIMESNPLANTYQSPLLAQAQMGQLIGSTSPLCTKDTEAKTLRCLYADTATDLITAQSGVTANAASLAWAPVLDGQLLQNPPLQSFGQLDRPVLLGTNHDEGTFFVDSFALMPIPSSAYVPTLTNLFTGQQANLIANQYPCTNKADCRPQLAKIATDYKFTCANRHAAMQSPQTPRIFGYQFNAVSGFDWPVTPLCPPNANFCPCADKVCHSAELPYVFGTPGTIDACGPQNTAACNFNPGQQQLSTAMMAYWTSFVTNQVPAGGVTWPWYPTYLLFDADRTSAQITQSPADPFSTTCCFFENNGFYGAPAPGCPSPIPSKAGAKKKR